MIGRMSSVSSILSLIPLSSFVSLLLAFFLSISSSTHSLSHLTNIPNEYPSQSVDKEVLRDCDFGNSINLVACAANNENECDEI